MITEQIYSAYAGQLAFAGSTVSDTIVALLNQEPTALKSYSPGVPDELQRIVNTALSKTKENRYQNVNEMIIDLKKVQQLGNEKSELPTQLEIGIQPTVLADDIEADVARPPKGLETYEFEHVVLNVRGTPIKRHKGKAHYFIEKLNSYIDLTMIEIQGGAFLMGSPENEEGRVPNHESPQHTVRVPPFYMSKLPITNAQWNTVVSMNVKGGTVVLKQTEHTVNSWLPRVNITWEEAVEFCERLSWVFMKEYRLPTEAEWEYACRAGTNTPFSFGETIVGRVANFSSDFPYKSAIKTPPRNEVVSSTSLEGVNAFGLYDMHGNVLEWCLDKWHDNYTNAPIDGSAWDDDVEYEDGKDRRVLRGGSHNFSAANCRSASRHNEFADKKYNNVGFRVVAYTGI